MFDFLKNLTKSDEEKQREAFSAYLDDTLSPSQRREFEAMLAEDADLRAEMELAQALRQQMRELPRRSVPRSFTLNPSVYKAPKKEPLVQAYPFLRAATVMTAFFFVMALGLSVFTTQGGNDMASVAQSAMEPTPAFEAPMADAEIAMEEAAEEPVAEEIVVEEIVVDGEAADETARAMPEEAAPRPTLAIAMTKSTEMQLELEQEEGLMEADDMANAAASSGAAAPPTATPLSTATVSALPRLEATATAVPRAIEPTAIPPGEIAKAEESETAVNETHPTPQQLPSRSPSTSQLLLIGLGILLLVLVVVTLLARRKI